MAGDVNADGYADVIVGAWSYDNDQADEGSVFVYHGSATSLSTSADWIVESNQASSNFGGSVSTAGDMNGDGYGDVIMGAHNFTNGQSTEGGAFAYTGTAFVSVAASATPTSGTAPLTVSFSGSATTINASIVKYEWDFESDGVYDFKGNSANVLFTYNKAGSYVARLRATDNLAVKGTAVVSITVSPPAATVTATASAVSTSGTAPFNVSFTGTGSGGTIVSYEWDFDGDGVYDWASATTGSTSYIYTAPGPYIAKLRVTSDTGVSVTATVTITVSAGSNPPTVSLVAVPSSGTLPLDVTFTATASDNGSIASYDWDFEGDGAFDRQTTASSSVSHTYTSVGVFTPKVVVKDNSGLTAKATTSVTVSQSTTSLKVWIVTPKEGDVVSGDRVSLRANTAPGSLTQSVQFQYKLPAGSWTNIGSAILPPVSSYATTWNTTGITNGTSVELRAVGTDTGSNTVYSNTITVTVNSTDPTISESLNAQGKHEKTQKITTDRTHEAATDDGTAVTLPFGTLASATTVKITKHTANPHQTDDETGSIGIFRSIDLTGDPTLQRSIEIRLSYSDTDSNGIVDGTSIQETALKVWYFDEAASKWKQVFAYSVNTADNYVSCEVAHLTDFGVFGSAPGSVSSTGSSSALGGTSGGGSCFLCSCRAAR
jgi:PKD repeat protein